MGYLFHTVISVSIDDNSLIKDINQRYVDNNDVGVKIVSIEIRHKKRPLIIKSVVFFINACNY